METTIPLKCAACGSDKFSKPENPKADDIVTCAGCGASGRYGDIMDSALKQAKEEIAKQFRNIFGKRR